MIPIHSRLHMTTTMLGCFFCFLLFCSFSEEKKRFPNDENTIEVNSGEANYEGNEIVLFGDVSVKHSLGEILATKFSIRSCDKKDKKNKFSYLEMEGDVEIELKGGGKLTCQNAQVDYSILKGVFLGSKSFPDVIYHNLGEKLFSNQIDLLLEMKSKKLEIFLEREFNPDTQSNQTAVKEIQSYDDVRVNYNNKYFIVTDQAYYQRLPRSNSQISVGTVILKQYPNGTPCKLTNSLGDELEALSVTLNTANRSLSMEIVQGVFQTKREENSNEALKFSSDFLTWNDDNQEILLEGHVNMFHNEQFTFNTDQKLLIGRKSDQGTNALRFIHVPQRVEMTYIDPKNQYKHFLTCPGSLFVDNEKLEMILEGIADTQEGDETTQVYLECQVGEMYADRIHIDYEWENNQISPKKITLIGHVRLISRFDGHVQESASVLHYALAEIVEYFPQQQELLLKSEQGNQVLFFDKINQVQMSAQSLKINRDPITNKEAVRGFGNVRFIFMERELEQIKKRFRLKDKEI